VTTDLEAASFLLALLAFLLSVGAIVYTRRATRAAERSAEASSRSAAVAEREEQRQLEETEARAVVWVVKRTGSAALRLTNAGEVTAHDVRVVVPSIAQVVGRPLPNGVSVHRGTEIIIGAVEYRARGQFMDVFWRLDPNGSEMSWHYPL
jgi:hypothetical protein